MVRHQQSKRKGGLNIPQILKQQQQIFMSLKDFKVDTPKEYAQIGMAISRLGTMMSGILLFEAKPAWVLASLFLTWVGSEIAQYFKLEQSDFKSDQPA